MSRKSAHSLNHRACSIRHAPPDGRYTLRAEGT
jgi:hypothetical protein